MSDLVLAAGFVIGAAVSLSASWLLVTRLGRVGARLGLSEALLGMFTALAADAPEITAAVSALGGHHPQIGAGVVIGSNVFNLAALLGFAAIAAGKIALHRRVIAMEGVVAVWIAAACLAVVAGILSAAVGLGLVLALMIPYLLRLGLPREQLERLGLPVRFTSWLELAVAEEELELEAASHPRPAAGRIGFLPPSRC